MGTIVEFMSADHQACDEKFFLAEQAAYAGNWHEADTAFLAFRKSMTHHFRKEKELLFPVFLASGGPNGPVQEMEMEHAQMNNLLKKMSLLVANRDAEGYSSIVETLLILLQQHNLKEEQILYPIADCLLAKGWIALRSRMQSLQ